MGFVHREMARFFYEGKLGKSVSLELLKARKARTSRLKLDKIAF